MTGWNQVVGGAIRTAGAISPRAAARVTLPLFMHIGRPMALRPDAEPTMSAARRLTVRVAGLGRTPAEVVAYEWGRGPDVVVLAHGWQGRASQFAPLVRELVSEGYRVVAFDAPAHGESAGRRTYLIDWLDALAELQRRYGGFHTVVGHSFGALAAVVAAADGLAVRRIVTVAGPADADTLLAQFGRMVGFGDPVAAALRRRFARRFFPGEADPFPRISAIARPLRPGTELLIVHDEGDRQIPAVDAARLATAHPGSRALLTSGLGHARILSSDAFLDATIEFVTAPMASAVGEHERMPRPGARVS